MQVGIPVAYSVCEVKLDKINHWLCVYTEKYIKTQAKVGLVIGCAKTLNQATVYGHYKKTNRCVLEAVCLCMHTASRTQKKLLCQHEVQRFGLSACNIPIHLFIMAMYSHMIQCFCTPDN